jgi:hypothetical protein
MSACPPTCPAARRSRDEQTPSGTEVRSGRGGSGGVGRRRRLGSRSLVPVPDDARINPVLAVPTHAVYQAKHVVRPVDGIRPDRQPRPEGGGTTQAGRRRDDPGRTRKAAGRPRPEGGGTTQAGRRRDAPGRTRKDSEGGGTTQAGLGRRRDDPGRTRKAAGRRSDSRQREGGLDPDPTHGGTQPAHPDMARWHVPPYRRDSPLSMAAIPAPRVGSLARDSDLVTRIL